MGKLAFARQLAATMLCREEREESACGRCRSCVQLAAGSHPDYRECTVEEGRSAILVEQVRILTRELGLSPQYGGARIAVIHPADALNINAANSLLKTLEEPAAGTLLLLVSARARMLPATIRSRCQRVRFRAPDRSDARAWLGDRVGAGDAALALAFTGDAPLHALALCEQDFAATHRKLADGLESLVGGDTDPIALAEVWARLDLTLVLCWLWTWSADLLRRRILGADVGRGLCTLAQSRLGGVDVPALFAYLDLVRDSISAVGGPRNGQQLLESVLIPWGGGRGGPLLDRHGPPATTG